MVIEPRCQPRRIPKPDDIEERVNGCFRGAVRPRPEGEDVAHWVLISSCRPATVFIFPPFDYLAGVVIIAHRVAPLIPDRPNPTRPARRASGRLHRLKVCRPSAQCRAALLR